MLTLTRKVGEIIYIGDNITIEITGIERGKVRLGIIAPPEVSIYRKEVYDRMQGEQDDFPE